MCVKRTTSRPKNRLPAAAAALLLVATAAPADQGSRTAGRAAARAAAADSGITLRGGEEGTAFRSLTVEGEDRIHVEFDRPTLAVELDPEQAPGLDWGSAHDVLDRTQPDLVSPLLGLSARHRSPYTGRPWLRQFASGAVATFRPGVEGVDRWKLVVVNSRGEAVASFTGKGRPPREISWDGRSTSGALVEPGRTYSSVFEAYDRAGNKRNFVGPGFTVSAYRLDTARGPIMVFTGDALPPVAPYAARSAARPEPFGGQGEPVPPLLLEAASWINQSGRMSQPIRVTAAARSHEEASALATAVARGLGPLVLGGAGRIQSVTEIQPDAPERGTVAIAPADHPSPPAAVTPARESRR